MLFWGFRPKGAKIGLKWGVKVLWKIVSQNISDFLCKVTVTYKLN